MRFLVTDESGRLARWLRLAGFDTVQMPATPLAALYGRAYGEHRVILTRNSRVKGGCLFRVLYLRSEQLDEQLRQVIQEVPITIDEAQTFSRCDRCNVEIEAVSKADVKDRVPPYVYQTQDSFYECSSCRRVYWAATHCERISGRLRRLLQ